MAKKTLYDEEGNPVEVEFPDSNDSGDNGPAELRKALKKEKTDRENLEKELATLKTDLRARSVKEVLDSKGVPAKVAKFIPSDVTAPDQIEAWLSENADVFGFTVEQSEVVDEANQANRANAKRITNATESAISATKETDILAKLNDPNLTRADLDALRDSSAGAAGGIARRHRN